MTIQCKMRPSLAVILVFMAGCATTAFDPAREIYNHGQDSIRRAKGDANDRVADEAQADILRAFMKLKGNLRENSSAALRRGTDMAETFRGQPRFSSQELVEIVSRLMDEASAADSRRLLDFRRTIANRSNPDGMDSIRLAVLDRELGERGIIMERAR